MTGTRHNREQTMRAAARRAKVLEFIGDDTYDLEQVRKWFEGIKHTDPLWNETKDIKTVLRTMTDMEMIKCEKRKNPYRSTGNLGFYCKGQSKPALQKLKTQPLDTTDFQPRLKALMGIAVAEQPEGKAPTAEAMQRVHDGNKLLPMRPVRTRGIPSYMGAMI